MKLLHISDLHIGKRLNEFPLIDDQRYILNKIVDVCDEVKSDGVIIAGDVYDRNVPSTEAVELFEDFLVKLNIHKQKVFIISGNHDSSERLAFGHKFLANSEIYISPVFNGNVKPIVLNDEFGELNIYLLPFVKPTSVRRFYPDSDIESYTDAMRVAIDQMGIDESKRNILVTHQFVTGAERSESEEVVGGTDNIDSCVFESFDYVALGHIHGPQYVGSNKIRYCGTPLKYSFSETNHKKSVTVLDIKEKGTIEHSFVELIPQKDMVDLKGAFETLMSSSFYEGTTWTKDYVRITLTDELEIPDAFAKLRSIYTGMMYVSYDNKRTKERRNITEADVDNKTEFELFSELYIAQNNEEFSKEQEEYVKAIIEEIKEETL